MQKLFQRVSELNEAASNPDHLFQKEPWTGGRSGQPAPVAATLHKPVVPLTVALACGR